MATRSQPSRSRYLDAADLARIVADHLDHIPVRATARAIGKSHTAVLKSLQRDRVQAMIAAERERRAAALELEPAPATRVAAEAAARAVAEAEAAANAAEPAAEAAKTGKPERPPLPKPTPYKRPKPRRPHRQILRIGGATDVQREILERYDHKPTEAQVKKQIRDELDERIRAQRPQRLRNGTYLISVWVEDEPHPGGWIRGHWLPTPCDENGELLPKHEAAPT